MFNARVLLSLAVFTGLSVSTAHAQSLTDMVSQTLLNHPQIEMSKTALDAAQEEQKEYRSAYFPQISVNATTGRIYGDNATSRGLSVTRGAGYSDLWEKTASVSQMLFDGFETQNRVDAVKASENAALYNVMDVKEQLAFKAVQTYINLMRARGGHLMLAKHEKLLQDYKERIETSVRDGTGNEAELRQAEDILLTFENFKADYAGQIKAAESDYLELVGELPGSDFALPLPPENMILENVEEAVAQAKEVHPILQEMQFVASASGYGVEAEKAAFYPDVTGELSYLKSNKEEMIGGDVEDRRAIVRMNWSFETGGAAMARVNKKKLERRDALAKIEETQRQVERNVRLAYAEYDTAKKQMDNQAKRLKINEDLSETYETQFEGALVSVLDLMRAQNQLLKTRIEAANSRYRYVLSQYAVLASLGRLQEALGLNEKAEKVANSPPSSDEITEKQ
ncbi:MAG: TolC family protein [Alphaproteobacteria bacterium]|nr:TolC family protein [Alphaproteobacteria bacterium]